MGTAGERWIPPRIDLASFPQPDVSSCWSGKQQGQLSPCRRGVSWTPCLGRAHFPGSNGQDISPSVPHSAGAAGSGTGRPLRLGSRLACSPIRSSPPLLQALSCCHGGNNVLALALCSPSPAETQPLSPSPVHGGHQAPLPESLSPVPSWV